MKATTIRRPKRLLGMLLAICMVLTIVPAFSFQASAAPVQLVYVSIPGLGSILLSAANPYLVSGARSPTGTLGSGGCTAQFIPATGTLRLHGFSGSEITTSNYVGDLTIDLIGTNTIENHGAGEISGIYCIHGSGVNDVTITSSTGGSLAINVSSTDFHAYGIGLNESPFKNGNFTIKGNASVSINASSGSIYTTVGMYTEGDISVLESASLSIRAISPAGDSALGVTTYGDFIVNTTGNVSIDVSGNTGTSLTAFYPGEGKQFRLTKVGVMTLKYSKNYSFSVVAHPAGPTYAAGDFTVDKTTVGTEIYTYTPGAGALFVTPENVTFTARQAGGSDGTADSTGIQLVFSRPVPGLAASDITVTNDTGAVVKSGSLTTPNDGLHYLLGLSSVAAQGEVIVSVASPNAALVITTPLRRVQVYKLIPPPALNFTSNASYNVPDGTVGTAIVPIDVSGGAGGGMPFSGSNPYRYSIAGPPWLSIDSITGRLTGTRPPIPQIFTTAAIKVEDNAGQTASITIDVGAVAQALAFTNKGFNVPAGFYGTQVRIDVSSGVSGGFPQYRYDLVSGPGWLTVTNNNVGGVNIGRIEGTRPATDTSATSAVISVTDKAGAGDTRQITIDVGEVSEAFVAVNPGGVYIPEGMIGTAFSPIDVSGWVAGGAPPYTMALDVTSQPEGWELSFSPTTGVLTGTRPGTAWLSGSDSIKIVVTDSTSPEPNKRTIYIPVESVRDPDGLRFMNDNYNGGVISLPAGEINAPIDPIDLSAYIKGGTAPIYYSVDPDLGGSNPAWLKYGAPGYSLSAAGVLNATRPAAPDAAQTAYFTIEGGGNKLNISIEVGEVHGPLLDVSVSDVPSGAPGSAFATITASASGGTGPYTYSLAGPSWLTVNAATGAIDATGGARPMERLPATTALLVVTDSAVSTSSVIIQVGAVAYPPIVVTGAADIPAGAPGAAIAPITVSASGGSGAYTYSIVGGPSWLSVNASTGLVTGTRPLDRLVETSALIVAEDSMGDNMAAFMTVGAVTLPQMAVSGSYHIPSGAPGAAIAEIDLSGFMFGGSGSFTFAKDEGPAWVSVTGAGIISGTRPDAQVSNVLKVKATDTVMGDSIYVFVNVGAVLDASTTYPVTVKGGAPDKTDVSQFDVVTITAVAAPSGFVFDKWVVSSGGAVLDDEYSSTTWFVMPGSAVVVTAVWKSTGGSSGSGSGAPADPSGSGATGATPGMPGSPFEDVKGTDWFFDDVIYVYDKGLMKGTGTSPMLFSPNASLTRGMIVTILYRLEGEPGVGDLASPFGDVADGQWYADAVKWASDTGIVTGYGSGAFGPGDNITRQDLAVILMRYMGYKEIVLPVTVQYIFFADEADIADYAMDAIQAFNKLGIINGVGANADSRTIVDPRGNATRAQVAAMLHRFLEKI